MKRDGKLVIRPDSGDPVDIICGLNTTVYGTGEERVLKAKGKPEFKGVIELLWDIFGGTINEQGYKVLDPHIGSIYGDSITLDRQVQIYDRLRHKGFSATNIVLGVGSYTYQYNTRDTFGFAAKGSWFEVYEPEYIDDPLGHVIETRFNKKAYNIYKDPVTDDGTKKSLKGLLGVFVEGEPGHENYFVKTECTPEEENQGILQVIYEDGFFYNSISLTEIRNRISKL